MSESKTAGRAAQPDSPEDLIAELARIMADGARDTPRQSTLQPVAPPPVQVRPVPAPQPAPSPAPTQAPVSAFSRPTHPAAPAPEPARPASSPFRFSLDPEPAPTPAAASPAVRPEPAAPTPRIPGLPRAESQPRTEPQFGAASAPAEPATDEPARIEPRAVPEWLRPKQTAAARPAAPEPVAPRPADDPFKFDFDLGGQRADAQPPRHEPAPAPRAEPAFAPRPVAHSPVAHAPQPAPEARPAAPTVDPIADLIARQLSEAMEAEPEPAPVRQPPQARGNPFPPEDDNFFSAPVADAPQDEPEAGFEPAFEPEPVAPMPKAVLPRMPAPQAAAPQRERQVPPAPAPRLNPQPAPRAAAMPQPRQQAPQPQRSRAESGDALADIENLIGQAARAEIAHGRRAAEPVVDERARAAEAAILRATSEAEQPELDARDRSPRERRRPVERVDERAPSGLGRFVLPAIVGTVLLIAAIGSYWFFAMNGSDEAVPVLSAGSEPVKQAAPAPEPQSSAGTAVFNQIEGNPDSGANEQLVPREQPAEDTAVSRVITPESTESGLANRKVRTVTVRPDGTIVSSDDGVAGSEVLPVERPDVPAIPGAAQPSDALASSGLLPSSDAQAAEPVAEVQVQPTPAGLVAPVPRPRLVNRAASPSGGGSAALPPLPTQPVAAPAAINLVDTAPAARAVTPVATASTGGAYVQMSSQRSEEAALASQRNMQSRYGNVLGGTLQVQRADLGDKGIYYRVRLPVESVAEGNRICGDVKAAGGDCFVRAE